MMTEKEKTIIEFHEKNLERINYWLQFAEAKNGAIIAFLVAIIAMVHTSNVISDIIMRASISIVALIALIIALLSMLPRYKTDVKIELKCCDSTKCNLLFWDDVANLSSSQYIEMVHGQFENYSEVMSDLEYAFVEEIITNARIAQYKYKMFRISAKVAIGGMICILIAMIICA